MTDAEREAQKVITKARSIAVKDGNNPNTKFGWIIKPLIIEAIQRAEQRGLLRGAEIANGMAKDISHTANPFYEEGLSWVEKVNRQAVEVIAEAIRKEANGSFEKN